MMRFEETKYLGKNMPLRVIKNNLENLFNNEPHAKKGEIVTFDAFVGWEEGIQTFHVRTVTGERINMNQKYVEMLGSYINVDEPKKFKQVVDIKDVEVGMKFLTLDPEVSEIGAGQIVTILKVDKIYSDTEALFYVKNQWGGQDYICSNEIAFMDTRDRRRVRVKINFLRNYIFDSLKTIKKRFPGESFFYRFFMP